MPATGNCSGFRRRRHKALSSEMDAGSHQDNATS
jgi:hypothetical protein